MLAQQSLLEQSSSSVNEIRTEFVDSVVDDIQAFKAANPTAQFEDFIRWHSPRDWSPREDDPSRGVISVRMQGENPLRTLFDRTPAIPAVLQKPQFNPKVSGEVVLEYLRTLSPRDVLKDLILPFLGACCYIFDHIDGVSELPPIADACSDLHKVVRMISNKLDEIQDIPMDLLKSCQATIIRIERLASQASCLLKITGDKNAVVALLKDGFDTDMSGELAGSRECFIKLIKEKLESGDADAGRFTFYAESKRSSEDGTIHENIGTVGHRL